MRKGFEGLYGLARERLLCEPLSGHFFLFCNAQRNRLKILVWDGTGLWVIWLAGGERGSEQSAVEPRGVGAAPGRDRSAADGAAAVVPAESCGGTRGVRFCYRNFTAQCENVVA